MRGQRWTQTIRTTRPNAQGPDTGLGGLGGGGTAPTAPSDVTLAIPAAQLNYWGDYALATQGATLFDTWKTWGITGYIGAAGGTPVLPGYGGTQTFKVSSPGTFNVVTAIGDSNTAYDYQRVFEGGGAPSVNGQPVTTTNFPFGHFPKKRADPTTVKHAGLHYYFRANSPAVTNQGPFGDWFSSTLLNDVAYQFGLMAAGIKFLGGDIMAWDLETSYWNNPSTGHTTAALVTQAELWGYTIGTQMFTAFPAMDFWVYSWQPEGSWHTHIDGDPSLELNANDLRVNLWSGVMRAHMDMNATGNMWWADHYWYRSGAGLGASTQTGLKWNTQGALAGLSRSLSPAVWTHIAPYFHITPFSWAGAGGAVGGFYDTTQEGEPTWTNAQEIYRQFGMGGERLTYGLSDASGSVPGTATSAQAPSNYAGGSNYLTPTNRVTNMVKATDQGSPGTSGSYSTTAPTLSASASGSGSTRTLSGTAAHQFGIWWVEAYIYPSGTKVRAQMTWNLGGGSETTGLDNSFMSWTLTLTGVTAGNYAIVTAFSTLNQQHSVVVAL